MKLDDAIKLIKGPADSYVTLTVKKISGEIKDVLIQRGIVELEELYAKSTLINKGDKNYGYISLPKFYIDFADRKSRNSANDVKNEIIKLKNNGISGLILDLRNNGGGALQTVVDMTGLFIEKGPVVQVKSTGNRKQVLYDKDPQVVWDGPLVILMNKMFSFINYLRELLYDRNPGDARMKVRSDREFMSSPRAAKLGLGEIGCLHSAFCLLEPSKIGTVMREFTPINLRCCAAASAVGVGCCLRETFLKMECMR